MGKLKMNLYITRKYDESNNAGGKAPSDINTICKELGWQEYRMVFPNKDDSKIDKLCGLLLSCPKQWLKMGRKKGQYILYQHPMYFGTKMAVFCIPFIQKLHHSKVIVLLHDLESLRSKESVTTKYTDIKLINVSDYVICHNYRMKEYLISKGVAPKKIVELEIFDYLCEKKPQQAKNASKKNSIAIAGNLSPEKCSYIYKFIENNPELKINLYGVGYKGRSEYSNAEYHGSFSPEELPSKLDSAYGLVWDGPEITSCSGDFGEYLRFNNPHKLSLYMAAGIPVVTWKQAAIADFVEKHQVGIVVDSLVDLSKTLDQISEEQYAAMKTNAEAIGEKLREGFYFRRALQEIFDMDASKNETRSMAE